MLQRIKQTIQALTATFTPAMEAEIAAILAPRELELFKTLDPVTQCHCYRVYRELAGQPELLLKAALLHDIGKAQAPIKLWHRIAYVLIDKLSPDILTKFEAQVHTHWPALYVIKRHPELGAQLLQAIHADSALVNLVRQHHHHSQDPLLKLLKAADERH